MGAHAGPGPAGARAARPGPGAAEGAREGAGRPVRELRRAWSRRPGSRWRGCACRCACLVRAPLGDRRRRGAGPCSRGGDRGDAWRRSSRRERRQRRRPATGSRGSPLEAPASPRSLSPGRRRATSRSARAACGCSTRRTRPCPASIPAPARSSGPSSPVDTRPTSRRERGRCGSAPARRPHDEGVAGRPGHDASHADRRAARHRRLDERGLSDDRRRRGRRVGDQP